MRRGTELVALTGASGFLGRHLLKALLDGGYAVRALTHRAALPAHAQLRVIHGSVDDPVACTALVEGADVVIHAAGLVAAMRPAQFMQVNATATGILAQAAAKAGVSRFLLVSSLAARAPHLSPYATSKRAGEEALGAEAGAMAWDIIRPPALYGPGDANSLELLRMIAKGRVMLPCKSEAQISMLYIDDMVAAILAWLGVQAAPTGACYELADHRGGYRWAELFTASSQALKRPVRLTPVPRWLALMVAYGQVAIARFRGRTSFISPGKIRELAHADWSVDPGPFMAISGWQPRTDLRQGFAQTLAWFDTQQKEKPGKK